MNKKIITLLLSGLLIIPLTGCNLVINGKEIFNFSINKSEEEIEEKDKKEVIENTEEERGFDDETIINMVKQGEYTLLIEQQEVDKFIINDIINKIFENPTWKVNRVGNNQYEIVITDTDNEYIYFSLDLSTGVIEVTKLQKDNVLYEGENAKNKFANILLELSDKTKKETTTKEKENKKEQKKKEETVNKGFYKGEDGMYHCDKCHEVPSKEEYNSGVCDNCKDDPMRDGHMESVAPYGRCPKCNCANASDKGYQGDYCDDCFAKIKEEEYKEKHQYGDCIDCGVYLLKNQATLYGGRCPDCYARYYGDTDTNMGSCDRCGERVDLDHTNDGWGYQHLCGACTGELQMQENEQDSNPYAG